MESDTEIKWTRSLRRRYTEGLPLQFHSERIRNSNYRPFAKRKLYYDAHLNEMHNLTQKLFGDGLPNPAIAIMGDSTGKPYFSLAIDEIPDLNFVSPASGGSQTFSRFHIADSSERVENITDWALNKFIKHYGRRAGVTKDGIFAYCYSVLHDPVYREKYALNLKREFPRIPFYPDFAQWVAWGETLLELHIDYEKVEPWPLERVDKPHPKRAEGSHPKPKLKSVLAEGAETGTVVVDEDTQLRGIPAAAWNYRLGNRSAIDWVLDQHKEKKPRDPTIREKFNTYRFADYKESMIDLLARVVRVSVETVAITEEMQGLDRGDW